MYARKFLEWPPKGHSNMYMDAFMKKKWKIIPQLSLLALFISS